MAGGLRITWPWPTPAVAARAWSPAQAAPPLCPAGLGADSSAIRASIGRASSRALSGLGLRGKLARFHRARLGHADAALIAALADESFSGHGLAAPGAGLDVEDPDRAPVDRPR